MKLNLRHSPILIFILLIFTCETVVSQITISYPINRIVFQRDNSNQAKIEIAGSFSEDLDRIEAKLTAINGQGVSTNWTSIVENPEGGFFQSSITGDGGWYKLEVRGIKDNTNRGYSAIEKVGVGEVFLISGQSNAEGNIVYPGGNIGTTEDRVNSLNHKNRFLQESEIDFTFSQTSNGTLIGPYNPVPWFWARFAEKIVASENVPVLLYGCALGGVASEFWARSSNGEDLTAELPLFVKASGSPYKIMSQAIKYYANRTGLRAILWQQGESDHDTQPNDYYNNLRTVILKSRADIDGTIPWITALSSRAGGVISNNVRQGQIYMSLRLDQVFIGPDTDQINNPEDRFDGTHFNNEGLEKAANLWFLAIKNKNLLKTTTPILAKDQIKLNINCNIANSTPFSLNSKEGGYRNYAWSNGSKSSQIQTSGGKFSLQATDIKNILRFSPEIEIKSHAPINPSISLEGNAIVCKGESQKLISNYNGNFVWNNNLTSQNIIPDKSGSYFIKATNFQGCQYNSNNIEIKINPIPSINLIVDGESEYCSNNLTKLIAEPAQNQYIWSTGESTKEITPTESAIIKLKSINEFGCESEEKNTAVFIYDAPDKHIINQIGPFTLNTSIPEAETVLTWFKDEEELNFSDPKIRVYEKGSYKIITKKVYQTNSAKALTCLSEPSPVYNYTPIPIDTKIIFYPNPSSDYVQIEAIKEQSVADINLYSQKGILIKSLKEIDLSFPYAFDVRNLTAGLYIIEIHTDQEKITNRIIIK